MGPVVAGVVPAPGVTCARNVESMHDAVVLHFSAVMSSLSDKAASKPLGDDAVRATLRECECISKDRGASSSLPERSNTSARFRLVWHLIPTSSVWPMSARARRARTPPVDALRGAPEVSPEERQSR